LLFLWLVKLEKIGAIWYTMAKMDMSTVCDILHCPYGTVNARTVIQDYKIENDSIMVL
jgi:hypothetical protein